MNFFKICAFRIHNNKRQYQHFQFIRKYYYARKDESIFEKYIEDQEYLKDIQNIRNVLTDITDLLKEKNGNNVIKKTCALGDWESYFNQTLRVVEDLSSARFRHLTQLFTYPLTLAWIIRYLDAAGYLVNTKNNDTLNIVCAGSRAEGQIPYLLWEECASIVGRRLHIHFVGPMQVTHRNHEVKHKDILKLSYETGLYEPPPSLSKNNSGITPDIFVAFNSGNSDKKWQHIWRPTLMKASELKIPLIFTSYDAIDLASDFGFTMNLWNEEIKNLRIDVNNVDPRDILETIIHPTANPFLNMMPGIYDELPNRVIHSNQFIYGVLKK